MKLNSLAIIKQQMQVKSNENFHEKLLDKIYRFFGGNFLLKSRIFHGIFILISFSDKLYQHCRKRKFEILSRR